MTASALRNLGTAGYLAIFAWSILVVMIAPARFLTWSAAACLLVAALIYPRSFHRLVRWRWLMMIALLALPPVFLLGDLDCSLAGVPYSSAGLVYAGQVAVRMIVILLAVDGFTTSVDITSLAGLLERSGVHGLGFSIGVALNLLPSLQQSTLNAWRSLWMRGGLRRQRWRGLRLLLVTLVTNALSRAEEIALAAETRAFSPERSRALPLKAGRWDGWAWAFALVSVVIVIYVSGILG